MLQGLDIPGDSFMSGQSRWLEIGTASAVASLALLGCANWSRRQEVYSIPVHRSIST
jgi:hypothetical protein